MGSYQREKGKRGEREWAEKLRELGFADARRGVQYQGGGDSPDVVGVPFVHFEVKRTEKLKLHEALAQAASDALQNHVPVVAHRRNGGDWVVSIPVQWLDIFCQRWLDKPQKESWVTK